MIPDLSPPDGDSDFYFVQAADPETRSLNIELQAALNPAGERKVALRLDLRAGRQGHAHRERLRQGRALKRTLFALLDRYATMDHLDLDETKSTRPTPSDSTNEIMDAISRRVDGKLVVRTCRATRKGKSSCEFDCPLDDTDQAGEAQTRLRPGDDRPAGRIHRGPRPSEAVH